MEQLDSTIITTAVPEMATSLQVTAVQMNLAVTIYVFVVAIFTPVSGWLANRFGARRVFALALIIFTAASALCGSAQSFNALVIMRVLQGIGGAMMTPVGRLILLRSFPRSELVTAMTYMTIPATIGPVMGPLVGGALTTYLSWRWIFFVNLPFGLAGAVMAMWLVKETQTRSNARFDFPGFLLLACGIGLFQFGVGELCLPSSSAATTTALFLLALAFIVGFILYARYVAVAYIVDFSLFKIRSFRIGTLAGGLCRTAMNGVPFLLPLMLQVGFGFSAVTSGALTFVSAFSALVGRSLIGPGLNRHGFKRLLIWSALFASAGLGGFALLRADTPHWAILLYICLFGLARAIQFMTSNTLTYADVPDERLSGATSVGGVLQQLSVSLGISTAAVLLIAADGKSGVLTAEDFHKVFIWISVIPLLAVPFFAALGPADGREVARRR